ncbi:hypothetical protein MMC25_007362 [Agyrium rufum]|nr:hypothetical protein [Agyrium rufum]
MLTQILTFVPRSDRSSSTQSDGSFVQSHKQELEPYLKAHHAQAVYYGCLVEKPKSLYCSFFGRMRSSLKNFGRPAYMKGLKTLVEHPDSITVLHITFNDGADPSDALGANKSVGVTEVVFFYSPSSQSQEDRENIMSSVDEMRPCVKRSEALAIFDGWALEEDLTGSFSESKDAKSKVFVNLVGWADVDAHMRFQGSEDFQQNMYHLMGLKDMKHTEFYHVKLQAL